MNEVFLSTGSNLGDRAYNLQCAADNINISIGKPVLCSSVYTTAPWGITDQPGFLNQVLQVATSFSACEILQKILNIEQEMGRVRVKKMGARIIDIDLLFFNNEIINTHTLQVPHPYLHQRNFVLIPLAEIAANKVHPQFCKTIQQLLSETKDTLVVEKVVHESL